MSPYEVLGISEQVSVEEMRAAYVRSARASHPDRPGGSDLAMQRVNEAWAVLSDPSRKADFDLTSRRAREAKERQHASRTASGPRRSRQTTAPRSNVTGDGRMRTQESAPAWSPPPPEQGHASLVAVLPPMMLVIGGFLAMAGAAFSVDAVFAVGLIVVLLGGFGLLVVPILRLGESRRSDGPQ
ncbi:MAG: J domain-containing protein [Acidobacteria bacterium]|nr:J domain-containing protein [Acidobacteriota bacterium]